MLALLRLLFGLSGKKGGQEVLKKGGQEAIKKAEQEAIKRASQEAAKKAEQEAVKKAEKEAVKKAEAEAKKKAEAEAKKKAEREQCAKNPKKAQCKNCEPHSQGKKITVGRSMGDPINGKYQLYIANMHSAPLGFAITGKQIQEWKFKGVDFDGLWPSMCTLVEAKGQYAQFLEADKFRKFGRFIYDKLTVQSMNHLRVVASSKGAMLQWHFLEKEAHVKFNSLTKGIVPSFHTPMQN